MTVEGLLLDLRIVKRGIRDEGATSNPLDYPIFYTVAKIYDPQVIFECGTNKGSSSVVFNVACPEAIIHTWDICDYDKPTEFFTDNIVFHLKEFDKNVGEVLVKYQNQKKLIFIDGGHKLENVLDDFYSVRDYLMAGDVIMFHDSNKRRQVNQGIQQILVKEKEHIKRIYTLETLLGITVIEWNLVR